VEGATRLEVPSTNVGKSPTGPGAREKGQPFYNPGMALNRDLSVLLVEAFAKQKGREIDVADALAGTGARSVRLAKEVASPLVVHANDAQPEAVAAIRKAVDRNAVAGRVQVNAGDAHLFLAARRYDVVDLDPCGSPMPFLDAAVRATRHGGLLCATATDSGALAGTYPKACRRRYDAHHGLHAEPWRAEVGVRILGGAIVRAAARFDKVATPVLSIVHGHWMRVVARVEDGKTDADAALKRLANASVEEGLPRFVPRDATEAPWAGPLWSGPLHEATLLDAMVAAAEGKTLARADAVAELLALLRAEADAPAFWVVPDLLNKRFGPPPRRDALIERLRKAGFQATRTHIDPQGVRTDAGLDGLKAAWSVPKASG
jgi:tRNA (guanine26-N2/guanine27-N2)-dimethyltransferase